MKLLTVKLPLIVKLVIDEVRVEVLVVPAPGFPSVPITIEAHVIVPNPANEAAVLFPDALEREILVVTVRVIPLLTVMVPVVAAVLLNVTMLAAAAAVTVTKSPGLMITLSLLSGIPSPSPSGVPPIVHVAGVFQLPGPGLGEAEV